MARNRQRAKDRKQKKLQRENIPGSLDHASGDVEEVEARIVAGADGQPVEPDADDVASEPADAVEPDAAEPEPDALEPEPEPAAAAAKPKPKRRSKARSKPEPEPEPVAADEPDDEPGDDDFDDEAFVDDDARYTEGQLDATAEAVEEKRLGKGAGDVAVTPSAGKPGAIRLSTFFRACWAELQRVDWPDRRQVGQATAVVLGFVVVAGAFLGLADVVAQRIVDLIL